MGASADQSLVEIFSRSKIYTDYAHAFTATTGLPLNLNAGSLEAPLQARVHKNKFCAILGGISKTCALCLETQKRVRSTSKVGVHTEICFAGLCETGIPLIMGGRAIGVFQTGGIMLEQPTEEKFKQVAQRLIEWGVKTDLDSVVTRWRAKGKYNGHEQQQGKKKIF